MAERGVIKNLVQVYSQAGYERGEKRQQSHLVTGEEMEGDEERRRTNL